MKLFKITSQERSRWINPEMIVQIESPPDREAIDIADWAVGAVSMSDGTIRALDEGSLSRIVTEFEA